MKEHEKDSLYKDDWWLEHVEKELEPNLREDLELLLRNSRADRKIVDSLKRTRRMLKEADDVPMPESGLFYENLHNKIMSQLDDEPVRAKAVSAYAPRRKVGWSTYLAPIGMTMMVALVSWVTLSGQQSTVGDVASNSGQNQAAEVVLPASLPAETFERRLASVTSEAERAAASETMIGFESESDFIADAAEAKMDSLSPEQVEAIYALLKN